MLVNIYDKLPLICHNSVRADKLKVFNIEDSDNNITTTTITTTGNEEVHPDSFTGEEDYRSINWSERNRFGKWCSKYNPKHPHCPCEVVD